MIKHLLSISLFMALAFCASAQLTFVGSAYQTIKIKPEASTGLNDLYVLYDTKGIKAQYTAKGTGEVRWTRYSNLGGGYAEEVIAMKNGDTYSITLGSDDMGYIIEEGTDRYYCWVVNYANHYCQLVSLDISDESDCDRTRLELTGDADKITYYTINGAPKELPRNMQVEYTNLQYDADSDYYIQIDASTTLPSIERTFGVMAPLCDTHFTVAGDQFLKTWGLEARVESPMYSAIKVEAHTNAEQTERDHDNEQKVEANLGGSAPCEVKFSAAVTDAAIFREWQMSKDPNFETIDDRWQQLEFTYTFVENGNFYVRFVANNSQGTCEYISDNFEVFIGESDLRCPNIFTPNGDGVNDEWKVTYKSIVKYECHIFNRWGQEMISMHHPSQGWDGKYGGKYVPTGVYYYVIKAVGSDGRKYNLSGDINIIKSKVNPTSSGSDD